MRRHGAAILASFLLLTFEPHAPGAAALSCAPPATVDQIVAGTTEFGPLTQPYALVKIAGVSPTAIGVDVEVEVDATLRARAPVPSAIQLASTRDPMGTQTPMEDAAPGEHWIIPLHDSEKPAIYPINICSGAFRADTAGADALRAAGEVPLDAGPEPTTNTNQRSRDGVPATAVLAAAAVLAITAVLLIRSRRNA